METYIFNTNFTKQDEEQDKLISKQKDFMTNCSGLIAISSCRGLYNYNSDLNYTMPHLKSLCYGLYIEDKEQNIRVDKHFPKTKALFIATMWAEKDIYLVASNGYHIHGKSFSPLLKPDDEKHRVDLYLLDRIYLIYLKGDVRDHVLLEPFYVTYDRDNDYSIVSYGSLEPNNILKYTSGYTRAYSDTSSDLDLLNAVDCGYAIGDDFDISKFAEHVEHTNKFYFINKYIELYMSGE